MTPLLRRLFRGTILGLMLLLAGAANLVCISYDTDGDEDTPPVSVELNIVTPCRKSVQVPRPHTNIRSFRLRDEKPAAELLASVELEPAAPIKQGPPQLLTPLRR